MSAATGQRPRSLPQRTCVSCGSTTAKRELVRIVRTPQGTVEPDPTGKKPGRGAYLCHEPGCWEQGVKKGRLERALKTKLTAHDAEQLTAFAPAATAAGGAA
jgi:predicted RNA-binding protein YlxR (DUF448 family)